MSEHVFTVAEGNVSTHVFKVVDAEVVHVFRVRPSDVNYVGVGVVGPRGPAGPPGGGEYIHEEPTPSSEWIVNHNLGYKPNVQVETLGGVIVSFVEVVHLTLNQLRVYPSPPMAGRVRAV